jgi:hypothetical protein
MDETIEMAAGSDSSAIHSILPLKRGDRTPEESLSDYMASVGQCAQSIYPTYGRNSGMLCLTMTAEEFTALVGHAPPLAPEMPAVLAPDATAVQIARNGVLKKEYDAFVHGTARLKNAILKSNNIDEKLFSSLAHANRLIGLKNVTVLQLLTKIVELYGTMPEADLKKIEARLCAPWRPHDETIVVLSTRVKEWGDLARSAGKPVPILDLIQRLLELVCASPYGKDFSLRIAAYETATSAGTRTMELTSAALTNMWTDIRRHTDSRLQGPTPATTTPFGTAHSASISPTATYPYQFQTERDLLAFAATIRPTTDAARKNAHPTASGSADGSLPMRQPHAYCYTHGLGFHSSSECNTKEPLRRVGHPGKPTDSIENAHISKGSSDVARPRPIKPRKERTY